MQGYSPDDPKPLLGYAAIVAVFNGAAAGYALAYRRSGRDLPERLPLGDFMLLAAATQKGSRLISKDRVTSFLRSPFTRYTGEAGPSEVSEEPRGSGVRKAIGELLVCPYCLSQWVAAAWVAGYVREPRTTRTVAALFALVAASDLLNQAWVAVEERT